MRTTFEVAIDGRRHQGTWSTGDYDRLTVESDHGSTYAYLDGRVPETLARALLVQLVARGARGARQVA